MSPYSKAFFLKNPITKSLLRIFWRNVHFGALALGIIISGCAIYPLNKEYDARIANHDEMTLNMGASNTGKNDRFRDSLADLPKPLIGGYSLTSSIPKFIPFSRFLDKLEVGVGGIPIPFVFTLNMYAKYNFLSLPTHTFVSVYSNLYTAQLVAEYIGYSLRGGGIITQEVFWNSSSNLAFSSGIMFNKNNYAFYSAVNTKNEPDNITRKSNGTYLPFSIIANFKNIYFQCSFDYRIHELNKYTISEYPNDTKSIPFFGSNPNPINITIGYRFKSLLNSK